MAKRQVPKQLDPAEIANQEVLRQRQERIEANRKVVPTLDLGLKDKEPETAFQFLGDEWDRRAHGDQAATIRRTIYGPHPLVDNFPEMRARIEKVGLADYAAATYEAVITKGAQALPDPLMQRQLQRAILKFGKEAVAEAFRDRILEIPSREVEIDASDLMDPEIMGSNILHETVRRYERPGFSYKFLSPACVNVLGMRGYTLVKDDANGEVVKAGTLMLGEIRREIAEARTRRAVQESQDYVREIEEDYLASVRNELGRDASVLTDRDMITPGAVLDEEHAHLLGESRRAGMRFERTQRVEKRAA